MQEVHHHRLTEISSSRHSMADTNHIPEYIYEPFEGKVDKEVATMVYLSTNRNAEATMSALIDMVSPEQAHHTQPKPAAYAAPASDQSQQSHQAVSHDDDSGCEAPVANSAAASNSRRGQSTRPSNSSASKPKQAKQTKAAHTKQLGWTATAALSQDVQLAVSLWPVPSEDVFAVWGTCGGSADAVHLHLQETYPTPYTEAQGRMLEAYNRMSAFMSEPEAARDAYLHLAEIVKPLVDTYSSRSTSLHKASHAVVVQRHAQADKKGGHRVPHAHAHKPVRGGSIKDPATTAAVSRQQGRRGAGRAGRRGGRLQMASGSFAAAQPQVAATAPKADSTATLMRNVMKQQEEVSHSLHALCSDSRVLCMFMLESMGEAHLPGVCCLGGVAPPSTPFACSPGIVQDAAAASADATPAQDTAASALDELAVLAAAAKWETAEEAASIAQAAGLGVAEVRRGKVKVQLPVGRARQQVQFDAFGSPLVKRRGGRGGHATAPSPFGRSGGPVKEGDYDHVAMQAAFQEERSAGLDARRQRERVIQRAVAAKSAHGRFSGAVAGYFWEKAASLQDKAHAADAHESVRLLQRVNHHLPSAGSGVKLHEGCTVDLHGQLRRDAERMLNHEMIPAALANGIRTMQFVVGEGRHSSVGGDVHPLADTVKACLRAAVRDGRVQRFQRNGATFSVWM